MRTISARRKIIMCLLTAALLAVFAGAAFAADDRPQRTVSVSGRDTIRLVPDMAQLVAAVVTEAPTAGAARNENAKRCEAVIKGLRSLGISEEQIKTTNVNLYQTEEPRDKDAKKMRRFYRMYAGLTISRVPVGRVGEALDAAVKYGADNIESISYESSDYGKQYLNALRNAVKDAMNKAQAMAAADGMKLGKAISLSQNGGYTPFANSFARMSKAADSNEASMPVMPGMLEISASVSAVFELIP